MYILISLVDSKESILIINGKECLEVRIKHEIEDKTLPLEIFLKNIVKVKNKEIKEFIETQSKFKNKEIKESVKKKN